jgi:arylsulfatase A-like enzyme
MTNTLTRRQFVKAAAAAMPAVYLSGQALGEQTAARRPNIVFVFADQMRNSAMGCMGNAQVKTPHLDKLAGEGLLITNAISSHPVCTPYRAQLMTGQYGPTTGVVKNDIRLPDETPVLSTQMKAAVYTTGYIGKWHLAGNRKNPVDKHNRRDWDFWAVRNCSHQHFKPEYWLNDATEPTRVNGWEPDVQTDLACEFIDKQKANPFCLLVSYGPPHNPYKAPPEDLKLYDKPIAVPPNTADTKANRDRLHQYYAMVTSLDDCVGRISKALADAGVAENTVFIFTSDHGDMLGALGQRLKQRPWEESINVPLVIRYPNRIKAGQRKDWMMDSVDLMPTLLGLVDGPIPDGVQGLDQSDLLLGEGDEQRSESLLLNTQGGAGPGVDWRGVRTKRWTYAYHAGGDWVMYDLANDPHQMSNLADDPDYAEQRRQLREQVDWMRQRFGDRMALKGTKPNPIRLPG